MDKRARALTARGLACIVMLVAAGIASPATAQTPINEIKLAWDPLPGATGYRIYYGTMMLGYTDSADAGAATQATLALPTDGIPYHLAVKAYDPNGESMDWSREVVGWPRPEIGAIAVQCSVLPGGSQACVATVTGFNFAPTITASIPYPGVAVTGLTRNNSRSLDVSFGIDATVQAGVADFVLQQAWTVTPGTQPAGDNGVTGGAAGPAFGGAIAIGTVLILPAPQNVRFVN